MKTSTTTACLVTFALLLASATLCAGSPLANDNFADRQVIPSQTQVSVKGDTTDATQEAFEVAYSQDQDAGEGINETHTVWYSYTPPASGTLHISYSRFGDGETYLLLFKGSAIPTLAALLSQGYLGDDNSFAPPPDAVVTAGQEYTISLGNTNVPYPFTLTLTLTPDATTPTTVVPVASVTAKGKADRATGAHGKFVVSLSSSASADVTVHYKTSGNAVNGTDYKMLPGILIVPAGATSAMVKVKPGAATRSAVPTVAVKLKLAAGDGYTVGGASAAKVKIYDQN